MEFDGPNRKLRGELFINFGHDPAEHNPHFSGVQRKQGMARNKLAFRYVPGLCLGLMLAGLATLGAGGIAREASAPAPARDAHPSVTTLLNTAETVIGQTIAYPERQPARVTAVIVTMQPGETTGWHQHDVPMFGYIYWKAKLRSITARRARGRSVRATP